MLYKIVIINPSSNKMEPTPSIFSRKITIFKLFDCNPINKQIPSQSHLSPNVIVLIFHFLIKRIYPKIQKMSIKLIQLKKLNEPEIIL